MSAAGATRALVVVAMGVLAAGCAGADDAGGPGGAPSATPGTASSTATAVPPSVLDQVRTAAAEQAGVAPEEVEVVQAQDVRWSSAALDCPQEGQMYTQVITDGYWVVVHAGGEELDFRMADGGPVRLCRDGQAPAEVVSG